MAILKVIELLSNSKKGWEDATQNAVKQAAKTLKNLKSVNVTNMSATIKDGEIDEYRVNINLTFEVYK